MKEQSLLYKKIIKQLFLFVIIAGSLLILYHCCIRDNIPTTVAHLENNDQKQVIYSLSDGMELSQIFASPYDFDFLTLSFSDHDQSLEGETIISVKECDSGDIIKQEVISNHDIHYAVPVCILFDDLGGGKAEKEYEVTIAQRGIQELGLGIYGYGAEEKSTPAVVDGDEQEYSLSIGTHSYTKIYVILVRIVFVLSCVLLGILQLFSQLGKWKEEHFFCAVCLIIGLCMFLFLSLNNTNDGSYHYQNSYWYANKILGVKDEKNDILNMRTEDADVYQNNTHYYNGYLSKSYTSEMFRAIQNFSWRNKLTSYEQVDFLKLTQTTVWDRLPSVVGLVIGRIFQLGTYPSVWLSRIFSLAVYIVMVMYAIRIIPVGKMTLGFIAALPRCVYSAFTITYDSMINAFSFLVIALFLKLILEGLDKREKGVLLVVSFGLGACKGGVYLPILLLGILAFKRKNRKRNIFVLGTWMTAGISMLLNYGSSIFRYLGFSEVKKADEAVKEATTVSQTVESFVGNGNYDILYPLKEPLEYINLLCRTFVSEIDNYMGNIIQGDPHIELIFPATLIFVFIALLMYSAIEDINSSFVIKPMFKIVSFMIASIEIIGIMTVFLTVTPKGSEVLWGVNGRYFIPFLPLIFLLSKTTGLNFKQESKKRLYLLYGIAEAVYLLFYFKVVFFV